MIRRIEVTAEDIAKGVQGSSDSCPIALAVKRECRDDIEAYVDAYSVDLCFPTFGLYSIESSDIEWFVESFDEGEPVDPIAFDLDIPSEFLRETA